MGVRSGLYGDGWWRDNLRMTNDTFDILCNQLRPHLEKEKISQALPPLFFRAGSKVIRVLIARKEGEPGNEANHWLHFALTSHDLQACPVCSFSRSSDLWLPTQ